MMNTSATPLKPVLAFPVNAPFLQVLKKVIDEETGNQPGRARIILPTHRPARYFYNLYREAGKSVLLPKVFAYGELPGLWVSPFTGNPVMANQMDQIFLAWEACRKAAEEDKNLAARFSGMSMDEFLPWGRRLARLFEEVFANGESPENIAHVEGAVSSIAAALLGSFGTIGRHWVRELQARGWSTSGYETYLAFKHASEIPDILRPGPENHVYIAGFPFPDKVQKKLFRALWDKGATICVSGPAGIFEKEFGFYCETQKNWIDSLHARVEQVEYAGNDTKTSFFAGYDLHSQLRETRVILEKDVASSTAIVLPNPNALMPLLHMLPAKDVNIALGYPLSRTHFLNFLSVLFKMFENRNKEGRFYWKDVVLMLGQSFLGNLRFPESGDLLEPALRALEEAVRAGENVYVEWDGLVSNVLATQTDFAFFREIARFVPEVFIDVSTTAQLGEALDRLVTYILERFPNLWDDYKLDAEAIMRVQTQIIPVLKNNAMADEVLDFKNLVQIFDGLVDDENVPFEAFPISGLQVVGFNDAALLSFDNIIMLDVCEDLLPGRVTPDPLLPDELRNVLHLPDWRLRDKKAGFNFYRLISPASRVWILWQEGGVKSELYDNKKERSRFAGQLIWKMEQAKKRLLKDWEEDYSLAKAELSLENRTESSLALGAVLKSRLDNFVKTRINATTLNLFFRCPLAFGYKNLLKITGLPEVNEGDDARYIGDLVHFIMKRIYLETINKDLDKIDDFKWQEALKGIVEKLDNDKVNFKEELETDPYYSEEDAEIVARLLESFQKLPLDSRLMLKAALEKRIGMFMEKEQKELHKAKNPLKTKVLALEKDMEIDFAIGDETVKSRAKMDRIDLRDDKYYILDYKTGSGYDKKDQFWQNEDLFSRLKDYCAEPDSVDGDDLQQELYSELRSVQLPFYMLFLKQASEQGVLEDRMEVGGAAYIDFYDRSQELPLCDFGKLGIENILEKCELIIKFLFCRLKNCKSLTGSGDGCSYCDYALICSAR